MKMKQAALAVLGPTLALRAMTAPEQLGFEYELRAMRDEEGWRERARQVLQQALAEGSMTELQLEAGSGWRLEDNSYLSRHDGDTMLRFYQDPFWWFKSNMFREQVVSDEDKFFAQQVLEHAAVARRIIFAQVGANDASIQSLDFSVGGSCYSPGAFRLPSTEGELSSDAQEMCAALRGNTHVRKLNLVGWGHSEFSELNEPCELCAADLVLLTSVLDHTDVISVEFFYVEDDSSTSPPDLIAAKDVITKLCFDNVVRLIHTKSLDWSQDKRCIDGPMLQTLAAALPSNRHVQRDLALRGLDLKLASTVIASELQGFAATVRQSGLLSVSVERDGTPDHGEPWNRSTRKNWESSTEEAPPAGFEHAWNDIKRACMMNRKQLVCRRHQRLLLSTLHRNAGAESDAPLVQSPLFLNGDICELVCKYLDAPECLGYPMDWQREFAWHENDAAVAILLQKKRAYEQEFEVYQTCAKRRRVAEIVFARNIELVMSTTNVDRATAVAAMRAHGGDVSSTLMSMTEKMRLISQNRDEWKPNERPWNRWKVDGRWVVD
jgi:hypothetical protein